MLLGRPDCAAAPTSASLSAPGSGGGTRATRALVPRQASLLRRFNGRNIAADEGFLLTAFYLHSDAPLCPHVECVRRSLGCVQPGDLALGQRRRNLSSRSFIVVRLEGSENTMVERGMMMKTIHPAKLDDQSLLDAAAHLNEERRATAALLRALMEIDSRRLYLGQGCASMFTYCTQVLHLSEGGAYNRIEAARAARRYPVILELLEQSAITLTTVRLLSPHLTSNNHSAVLASVRHKSRREVEERIAVLSPKPDARVVVRRLPQAHTEPVTLLPVVPVQTRSPQAADGATPSVRVAPVPTAMPLTPNRYRIQLTVSRETHDRFLRAQALLRHAVPSGDAAEIFDRAIRMLLADLERRKAAQVPRPRRPRQCAPNSRHIPAVVRRAVWKRDQGCCAFVGASGRCRETGFLEFHHVQPFATGGKATVENIELRCRAHNAFEASLVFGPSAGDVVREATQMWG